jgi:hypothetical protein
MIFIDTILYLACLLYSDKITFFVYYLLRVYGNIYDKAFYYLFVSRPTLNLKPKTINIYVDNYIGMTVYHYIKW